MKILLLYDYPAPPGGLATQGELLLQGLRQIGVEAFAANLNSSLEKEWYYRWLKPDAVVGVSYWGRTPEIIMHPQAFGMTAVPWLVADGFIANYQEILNALPLILVTSNWVRDVYARDGIRREIMEVLPVGCNTDLFTPREADDPKVAAVRQALKLQADELMILTIGGDGASKGAREVMAALAESVKGHSKAASSAWTYICKVWPQDRTYKQNQLDRELADRLGISDRVVYSMDLVSRNLMPYLIAACDIYAAPSRLEGFGMAQIEAGACGKPVIGIAAMGMLDTLVHEETALLARVAKENFIREKTLGQEAGFSERRRVEFDPPRIADYRADVGDLRLFLESLIEDSALRTRLGISGRQHVVEKFDYRVVARNFVEILTRSLDIA